MKLNVVTSEPSNATWLNFKHAIIFFKLLNSQEFCSLIHNWSHPCWLGGLSPLLVLLLFPVSPGWDEEAALHHAPVSISMMRYHPPHIKYKGTRQYSQAQNLELTLGPTSCPPSRANRSSLLQSLSPDLLLVEWMDVSIAKEKQKPSGVISLRSQMEQWAQRCPRPCN